MVCFILVVPLLPPLNVSPNVVTPVSNPLPENPSLPSTALANVDFVSFAKAVLPDKSLIVNVGAPLDKMLVSRTALMAKLSVLDVKEPVLLKARLLPK